MLFKNIQVEDLVLIFLWISQILIYFIHFGMGYSFNVDVLFIYGMLKFIYRLVSSFPGFIKQSMKDNDVRTDVQLLIAIAWYGLFYVFSLFALVKVLFGKRGIIHLI